MPGHHKGVGPVWGTNAPLCHIFFAFNADAAYCVGLESWSNQLLNRILVNVEDEFFFFDGAGESPPCLGAEVDKGLCVICREASPVGVHGETLSPEVVNDGKPQSVAVGKDAVGRDAEFGGLSAETSARSYSVWVGPVVGDEKTVALSGREDILITPGG